MNRKLVTIDVLPLYGHVEIGDRDAVDVPQWETGEELVVSNETSLCVSTRPDSGGSVRLTVLAGDEAGALGHEVFSGELALPSGVMAVGNSITGQVEEVDLSPARSVDVRIFVEPPVSPNRINVLLPSLR